MKLSGDVLCHVRPEWVDHYGHMNLAYYLVAFDLATDALWPSLGLGDELRAQGLGTFAVESWQGYVREVHGGAPLAADSTVLGADRRRLLLRHRLRHAAEGWLAAENEVLFLCVDLATRRAGTWPAAVLRTLEGAATGEAPQRLRLGGRASG